MAVIIDSPPYEEPPLPPNYRKITATRITEPDPDQLLATLRQQDPTVGIVHMPGTQEYRLKKNSDWTDPQANAAKAAIEAAPADTPQRRAQAQIDALPLEFQALVLALIDQINTLRAAMSPPLQPVTKNQAFKAIRDKAADL